MRELRRVGTCCVMYIINIKDNVVTRGIFCPKNVRYTHVIDVRWICLKWREMCNNSWLKLSEWMAEYFLFQIRKWTLVIIVLSYIVMTIVFVYRLSPKHFVKLFGEMLLYTSVIQGLIVNFIKHTCVVHATRQLLYCIISSGISGWLQTINSCLVNM